MKVRVTHVAATIAFVAVVALAYVGSHTTKERFVGMAKEAVMSRLIAKAPRPPPKPRPLPVPIPDEIRRLLPFL